MLRLRAATARNRPAEGRLRARASARSVWSLRVRCPPFARRARNMRGMAVRPSPASTEGTGAFRVRTPPGSRTPRETQRAALRVAGARSASWSFAPWMPTLRPTPLPREASARSGRATTESTPISERHRRFERHRRADRPLHQLFRRARGSAFQPARATTLTFEARAEIRASGLERRAREPRHPSDVSMRHALVTLRFPESLSPHPSGCDPDEACAHEREL